MSKEGKKITALFSWGFVFVKQKLCAVKLLQHFMF